MKQYEAMFLFDPTIGATFEPLEAEIKRLMDRIDAEIVFCKKWDERRLAYRIKGCKRGVYVLVYFNADGNRITDLERDARISESVLRIMVLRAEGVTPEMMEQAAELRGAQPDGGDGDSDSDDRDRGDRDRGDRGDRDRGRRRDSGRDSRDSGSPAGVGSSDRSSD